MTFILSAATILLLLALVVNSEEEAGDCLLLHDGTKFCVNQAAGLKVRDDLTAGQRNDFINPLPR